MEPYLWSGAVVKGVRAENSIGVFGYVGVRWSVVRYGWPR
jgi:hypothetical protein